MKIIDQTRSRGRHAVQFIAESPSDEKVLKQIFDAFRAKPKTAHAVIEQSAGEDFCALRIEENEP